MDDLAALWGIFCMGFGFGGVVGGIVMARAYERRRVDRRYSRIYHLSIDQMTPEERADFDRYVEVAIANAEAERHIYHG